MTAAQVPPRPRRQKPLRAFVRRTLAFQALPAVAVVVTAVVTAVLVAADVRQIREGRTTLLRIEEVRSETLSAETALRGFVIVERPSFLEPYVRAEPRLDAAVADLRALVADDRGAMQDVDLVARTLEEWRRFFARPIIDDVRSGSADSAVALSRTGRGKRRIDTVRRALDRLAGREARAVAGREAAQRRVTVLGAALISAACALLLAGTLALRRRLDRSVVRPIAALSQAASALAADDLSSRAPVRGSRVSELAVVAREFNHMADRLERYVSELRELSEERSRLASTVSHELRTPLTSITGYAEGLLDGEAGELTPAQRDDVQVIMRNAHRIDALVADVLVASRLDARHVADLDRERFDLTAALGALIEDLGPVAAGRGVSVRLEGDEAAVVADRALVEQAALNLLSNAIKFSAEGGTVRVAVRHEEDDVVAGVRDEGVGIPAEEVARIGERFFRASTARSVKGTGLGVAITREIAERHGGTLEVESEAGHGACFRLRLPAAV